MLNGVPLRSIFARGDGVLLPYLFVRGNGVPPEKIVGGRRSLSFPLRNITDIEHSSIYYKQERENILD